MENRLMDKHEVASFLGGISPRAAAELMRSMPCVNVGNGEKRPRMRVYLNDLEKWLESRKAVRSPAARSTKTGGKNTRGEGLDENGFVLKRKSPG